MQCSACRPPCCSATCCTSWPGEQLTTNQITASDHVTQSSSLIGQAAPARALLHPALPAPAGQPGGHLAPTGATRIGKYFVRSVKIYCPSVSIHAGAEHEGAGCGDCAAPAALRVAPRTPTLVTAAGPGHGERGGGGHSGTGRYLTRAVND